MIELIALAASTVLVPAIAAFAWWITKKRIDELQDEVFALSDGLTSLAYKFTLSQNVEPKEITDARSENLKSELERHGEVKLNHFTKPINLFELNGVKPEDLIFANDKELTELVKRHLDSVIIRLLRKAEGE